MITYKAIGRSVLNYGAPIWSPGLSATRWQELQAQQNTAIRTITGCLKKTNEKHLHLEANMLQVKQHNFMLSKQYFLRCHQTDHVNRGITDRASNPSRLMRPTLATTFPDNHQWKTEEPMDKSTYRAWLKDIHNQAHRDGMRGYKPPVLLGGYPPPVSEEEKDLPRSTRCKLAQLRAGYSSILNNYLAKIDPGVQDTCPKCAGTPHDVKHLFNCPRKPTTLTTEALWTAPKETAAFLELDIGGDS